MSKQVTAFEKMNSKKLRISPQSMTNDLPAESFGSQKSDYDDLDGMEEGLEENDNNNWINRERLYQQSLVDAYSTEEAKRLCYIRDNWRRNQAELYKGLRDAATNGHGDAINFRYPKVERLPFHLKDAPRVYFEDGDGPDEVVDRESIEKTKFLQWMKMNQVNESACQLTYADFPTKYVWNSRERIWTDRKKGRAIGRVRFAYPKSGERYYLRLLLNHVKGAKHYEDIKEFNGRVYDTFKEACIARGLLEEEVFNAIPSGRFVGGKGQFYRFKLIPPVDEVVVHTDPATPLTSSSIDVAIFCLSLMGTNFPCFLREAQRVLKPSGWLLIAEVKSRFDPNSGGADPDRFLKAVCELGFISVSKDFSNKMFLLFFFKKKEKKKSSGEKEIKWPELKPCLYKRR